MDQKLEIVLAAKDATAQAFGFVQGRLNVLKSQVFSLQGAIGGLVGAYGIKELASSFLDAGIYAERMGKMLTAATGSVEASDKAQKMLRDTSERLGLVFQDQIKGYGQLAAAAKGTNLEGEVTKQLYLGLAEASTALQLSQEDTAGAIYAVQQMISKGKVSAEELRQQLGERLPGAFQIAAKAIGVTTSELDKMLKEGKVISEDFLPKFGQALRERFGKDAAEGANTAQASINRLKNTWFELRTTVMESGLLQEVNKQVGGINKELKEWLETNEDLIKQKVPEYLNDLKDAVKGTYEFIASHKELFEFGLIGLAVYGKKGAAIGAAVGEFAGEMKKYFNRPIEDRMEEINMLLSGPAKNWAIADQWREEYQELGIALIKLNEQKEKTFSFENAKASVKDFAKGFVSDIRPVVEEINNHGKATAEVTELSAEQKKELAKDLKDIENALKNFEDQSENAWHAYDLSAEDSINKTKEFHQAWADFKTMSTEGMQGELDALMQLQHDVDAGIEESVKSLAGTNLKNYEHFLDRVQDLAVDVFETITDTGVTSWEEMVDNLADTWQRFMREIAAQQIRQYVEVVVTKKEVGGTTATSSGGGGFSSLFSMFGGGGTSGAPTAEGDLPAGGGGGFNIGSMFGGGGGGTSMGSGGGMSVLSGITSGWNTYRSATAANEDIYGHGQLSSPGLAAANSAISSFFANYYGGPIMGMINDAIVMPLMNNAIWGQKNLQWGLSGGPKMEGGSDVQTALGRIGAYDKHQDLPNELDKQIQQFLATNVAPMAAVIAKGFSETELAAIQLASEKWKGDESAKITAEGLAAKSLDWLKSITKEVDGWMADFIQDWSGSLEDLADFLAARESTFSDVQATVDAILRPKTQLEILNAQFDSMYQIVQDLHGEEAMLKDIRDAQAKSVRDLAAAERQLTQVQSKSYSRYLPGTQEWNMLALQNNIRSFTVPDAAQAAEYLKLPNLSPEITTYLENITGSLENVAEASQSAAYATDAYSSALSTITGAIGSINDLVFRLTGGDLAPVQSAEFFTGQYSKLLGAAGQDPANVGALTSFVPGMMDFFSGIGGDYNELTQRVIKDLMGLKSNLAQQELTINVNVLLDGQVIGNTVARQTLTNVEVLNRFNEMIDVRVGRA